MAGFDLPGSVQAGQGLLSPVAAAFKKFQDQETTDSYNDAIMDHAINSGMIGVDEYAKYKAASHTQKTGLAAGIAANIHQNLQLQQQQQQLQLHRDTLANQMAIAHLAHDPSENAGQIIYHPTTGEPIGITGDKGEPRYYPHNITDTSDGSNGPIQVDPFVDPTTQKAVPGMGIVRKTGQIGYFGALLQNGGVPIETDPTTGMKFYRDAKGNPKPLDPSKVLQSSLTQPQQQAPVAPPAATPSATPMTPQPGEVRRGYKFKGGNPADQNNWEKVQ